MRAKGIIAKPMPSYWYDIHKCIPKSDDDEETIKKKEFNRRIVASNKPYFMTYVYPSLRTDNNTYTSNNETSAEIRFGNKGIHSLEDLYVYEPKTNEMIEFIKHYEKYKVVGDNACVVNRISWLFEKEFDKYITKNAPKAEFDYSIMKSNVGYSSKAFMEVQDIYNRYQMHIEGWRYKYKRNKATKEEFSEQTRISNDIFRKECEVACSNEDELCDILIDLCYRYSKSKSFVWEMVGDKIVDNLIRRSGKVEIPVIAETNGEFSYCGQSFRMVAIDKNVEEDE